MFLVISVHVWKKKQFYEHGQLTMIISMTVCVYEIYAHVINN